MAQPLGPAPCKVPALSVCPESPNGLLRASEEFTHSPGSLGAWGRARNPHANLTGTAWSAARRPRGSANLPYAAAPPPTKCSNTFTT